MVAPHRRWLTPGFGYVCSALQVSMVPVARHTLAVLTHSGHAILSKLQKQLLGKLFPFFSVGRRVKHPNRLPQQSEPTSGDCTRLMSRKSMHASCAWMGYMAFVCVMSICMRSGRAKAQQAQHACTRAFSFHRAVASKARDRFLFGVCESTSSTPCGAHYARCVACSLPPVATMLAFQTALADAVVLSGGLVKYAVLVP